MSWLFELRRIPSKHNGELVCTRRFGAWTVSVGGYYQTGPYMTRLWEKAIRLVPKRTPVKRVLLLGLGAGGNVKAITRRFPKAKIVALEWDEEMVALAKTFHLYGKREAPEVVFGDAGETVKRLTGQFDLVVFDLYRGNEPSPLLWQKGFLMELARLTAPEGYLLFNVFARPEAFVVINEVFSRWGSFTYKYNQGAVYRPFGNGNAGDPIVSGFTPFRAVPTFLRKELASPKAQGQLIETQNGVLGRRWSHGPLTFEAYCSDMEPILPGAEKGRIVLWQPLTRTDMPRGWGRSWIMMNIRKTGYAALGPADGYWKAWSSHAQRHRKEWLKYPAFRVAPADGPTFLAAYERARLGWLLKSLFVWLLKRRILAFADDLHGWLAYDEAGKPVAGLCVQDLPSVKSTLHVIAFYDPSVARTPVNYGLIDTWARDALAKGFKFLDFDIFWAPGDPREWKGFSKFKSQFGTRFIRYPNPLFRWVK